MLSTRQLIHEPRKKKKKKKKERKNERKKKKERKNEREKRMKKKEANLAWLLHLTGYTSGRRSTKAKNPTSRP